MPDNKLAAFNMLVKNFVEKWKIVQDCQKFYTTNPTGDYIYFTQAAFEFCQKKKKRKALDGNLEIFQRLSDESFKNCARHKLF